MQTENNTEPHEIRELKRKAIAKNKRYAYIASALASLCLILIIAIFVAIKASAPSEEPLEVVETITDLEQEPIDESVSKPVPPPPVKPSPPTVHSVKMTVTGDIMLHEWQANDAYNSETGEYEFDYTFKEVANYLQRGDFTIGNLETTFAGADRGYAYYPTFNAPDSFGTAIKNAGFDFLTTANNHANDKGERGILRTLDMLEALGIPSVGTYRSQEDRDTVCIKEINGIRFAFLSYSYSTNGIPLADGKPYLLNLLDEELIIRDIKAAKLLNPDFIIVMPHMGIEYAEQADARSKRIVQMMFEAGADIVLASHPHVLQPLEFVDIQDEDGTERRCFVIYSLGNFVSSQRTFPRERSIILNLHFEKTEGEKAFLKDVSYVPTWVKWTDSKGRQNIKILPIYDTLLYADSGVDVDLRPHDITHIRTVLKEITGLYGGELSTGGVHFGEYLLTPSPREEME